MIKLYSTRPQSARLCVLQRAATLATLCLLCGACQSYFSGYAIERYSEEDARVVRMADNYLGGAFRLPGKIALFSAQLNLQRTEFPDQAPIYSFFFRAYDFQYLKIPPGPALELVVDGRSFRLEGPGSERLRRVAYESDAGVVYQESAYFRPVSEELLAALKTARQLRVIVRGENGERTYFAEPVNRSNFRRFLEEFGPTPGE